MRISLKLRALDNNRVPANYNYPLAAAISMIFKMNSERFSLYLSKAGIHPDFGNRYDLFTFGLRFENYAHKEKYIQLYNQNAHLYISAPLIDEYLHENILGTITGKKFFIVRDEDRIAFEIVGYEIIPDPQFKNKMKFKLFAPIVLTSKNGNSNGYNSQFLLPKQNEEINATLTKSLLKKKNLLINNSEAYKNLKIEWDRNYIKKHPRITKLINISKSESTPAHVIGIKSPFVIEGDPELIKTGYHFGFGEFTNLGFGLAEIVFN